MAYKGKPRFDILDHGDSECLPVVAARLNPACGFPYDDIDLQHAMSSHHWFVCAYKMEFTHPLSGASLPLFCDAPQDGTMLRIVVKSNLTMKLAENLVATMAATVQGMDQIGDGYSQLHHTGIGRPKIVEAHRAHAGKMHAQC